MSEAAADSSGGAAARGPAEVRLRQRAQYVADGVAVGIVALNPDPAHPAARLVLRELRELRELPGTGGHAELHVTARPGSVVDYAGRRFTVTAVAAAGPDGGPGHVIFRDEPSDPSAEP